jgi:NTP pyrophosphatase (non-canonical NTP hydrolase)
MDIRTYQKEALKTDQVPISDHHDVDVSRLIPLLGLAGEAGELLTEYKKRLRDGDSHQLFRERVREELGDLLWYIANAATKFDLDLGAVAEANLEKVRDRWGEGKSTRGLAFDARYPDGENLPRLMEVIFTEVRAGDRLKVRMLIEGQPLGDDLTDNAHNEDGYRFHDVVHLAFAAVLGWSPVVRKLLGRKRKSEATTDEVEDGARAAAIEEGLCAVVFEYARNHNYLAGISALDYDLLRTIKSVTAHLEVSKCGTGNWEQAILQAYSVWRELERNRGGRVALDLDHRTISYLGPSREASVGKRSAVLRSG